MALRDLLIRIGGDTTGLDKALGAAEKRLGGLSGKLGGVIGGLAAGFSVNAIVDASIEAEKAVSGLEAVLASTGNTTGLTRDRLIELSGELQKVSTFGDEAILEAETNLARFSKLNGKVFERALQASLDLGTRTGDLAGAAQKLGRALEAPVQGVGALAEAGVVFTAGQQAQVKALVESGRTLDAQKILLAGLETAYGGTARAATDTFGGALTQLKEAAGDLLENPNGLRANTQAVKDFTAVLQDPQTIAAAAKLTQAIFDGFSNAAKAIARVVELSEFVGISIGKIVAGPAGDVTFLSDRIGDLREQLERLQRIRAANPQAQNDLGLNKAIERTSAKLADLEARQKALANFGGFDEPKTATPAATPAGQLPSNPRPLPAPVLTPEQIAKAAAAAREAYAVLKAQLDGQLASLRESVTRELAEIDRQVASNDLGFAAAAEQRIAAQQRVIDAELAARRTQLATTKDESDRAALIQQITRLEQQRGEVAVDARRDQVAAEQALRVELEGVANDLKRATGDELGAQLDEIETQYLELLKRLRAEGNTAGVSLVEQLIGAQKGKAQLDDLERRIGEIQTRNAARQQSIANQRTAGLLSERRASELLIEANLDTADSLDPLIAQFEALAKAADDPAALARIEELRGSILQLRDTTSQASKAISASLRQGFEGVFTAALRDINSVDDALKNLLITFLDTVAQMSSKVLVDSIFGAEGGKGDGLGKIGDLISGVLDTGKTDSGGSVFSGVSDFFGGLFGGDSAPASSAAPAGGIGAGVLSLSGDVFKSPSGDSLGGLIGDFGSLIGDAKAGDDLGGLLGDFGGLVSGFGDGLDGLLGGLGSLFGGGTGGGGGAGGAAGFASLFASLFHTGGVAGGHASTRMVPDLAYALAPRYHSGGIAGFAPDEVPAILKRGEEVLTGNDPRHRDNGGRQSSSAPAEMGVRIINVVDPSIVEQYMNTPNGEKLVINAIRRNAGAVSQVLR